MTKKIEELTQNKKEYPKELIYFVEELRQASLKNIEEIKKQIADAEQELADRRSRGENI